MRQERLYSVAEAAEFLAIPASTLARKANRDQVPHRRVFKHIRFSRDDLEAIQQVRGPR